MFKDLYDNLVSELIKSKGNSSNAILLNVKERDALFQVYIHALMWLAF